MQTPLKFDEFQQPIPIVNWNDSIEAGYWLKSSGYGIETPNVRKILLFIDVQSFTSNDFVYNLQGGVESPTFLNSIYQELVEPGHCSDDSIQYFFYNKIKTYPSQLPFLCGSSLKSGTCFGDSGGPAVIDGKLVGISVSSGKTCDSRARDDLSIYLSVKFHYNWILHQTGDNSDFIKELSSNSSSTFGIK